LAKVWLSFESIKAIESVGGVKIERSTEFAGILKTFKTVKLKTIL
jgi:hypothetical protein